MEIKETCCCGAKFEVSGKDNVENVDCSRRHSEFLVAHQICRENYNNKEEINSMKDKKEAIREGEVVNLIKEGRIKRCKMTEIV